MHTFCLTAGVQELFQVMHFLPICSPLSFPQSPKEEGKKPKNVNLSPLNSFRDLHPKMQEQIFLIAAERFDTYIWVCEDIKIRCSAACDLDF